LENTIFKIGIAHLVLTALTILAQLEVNKKSPLGKPQHEFKSIFNKRKESVFESLDDNKNILCFQNLAQMFNGKKFLSSKTE